MKKFLVTAMVLLMSGAAFANSEMTSEMMAGEEGFVGGAESMVDEAVSLMIDKRAFTPVDETQSADSESFDRPGRHGGGRHGGGWGRGGGWGHGRGGWGHGSGHGHGGRWGRGGWGHGRGGWGHGHGGWGGRRGWGGWRWGHGHRGWGRRGWWYRGWGAYPGYACYSRDFDGYVYPGTNVRSAIHNCNMNSASMGCRFVGCD